MPVKTGKVLKELKQFRSGAPKRYSKLPVKKLESVARPGINSLTFRAVVTGEFSRTNEKTGRKGKRKYRTAIQFFELQYADTKSKFFSVPAKVGGKLKYHQVPNLKENSVKLKCECDDFRFRFEKELFDEKGLIGRFRKYVRKTPPPPEGHPYANPDDLLGYCKHVHSLLLSLKNAKRIKG